MTRGSEWYKGEPRGRTATRPTPSPSAAARAPLDSMALTRRVAYIHSEELTEAADALPSNVGRAGLVHRLVAALDLLEDDEEDEEPRLGGNRARVVEPLPATREQLTKFHDERYVGECMLWTRRTLVLTSSLFTRRAAWVGITNTVRQRLG